MYKEGDSIIIKGKFICDFMIICQLSELLKKTGVKIILN